MLNDTEKDKEIASLKQELKDYDDQFDKLD
jgi:hypothetical protein